MANKKKEVTKKVTTNNVKKTKPVETKKTAKKVVEETNVIDEIIEEDEEVFEPVKVREDNDTFLKFVCFICPIIAFILLFRNKEKYNKVKAAAFIGLGIWIFAIVSFYIPNNYEPKKQAVEANNNIDEWIMDTQNGETVVTVLGSSTCPHCQEYKPVITQLSENLGFKLYFFEMDTLSEEETGALTTTYELKNYEGLVPYTYIVKENKFVSDTTGYQDEETTIKFLQDNKIISE